MPVIGLCMGMQLLFESTTELGGAEGIGLLRGPVEALDAPGLKVPQIGWNPVSWRRESPLTEGLPSPCAFYHANSFAPRPADPDAVLGTAEYGSRVRERGRAAAGVRPAVAPGEVRAGRAAPAEELRVARLAAAMILLPAVDIRDGKAVRLRQGHFDDETVYADDPLEAARSFVEAGAQLPARGRPRRRARGRAGQPAPRGADRLRARRGRGARRRPALDRVDPARARGGRDARRARHRRVHRPRPARRGAAARSRRAILVGVDVRGGLVSVSGWTQETQMRGDDAIRRLQSQGATRFVYTNVDRDGMLEGPDLDEVRRISEAVRGPLPLLRRHRLDRGPPRAALGSAREPRRRDLGQGALRGPLRRPRGPGGARLMLLRRVIPCLDVDKGRVVKGVEFVNLRDAGDPVELAVRYQDEGARRDRLPRHHRLAREARDRGGARPPLRRRRVHPVHDRRRGADASTTPRRCSTPAPTRSP